MHECVCACVSSVQALEQGSDNVFPCLLPSLPPCLPASLPFFLLTCDEIVGVGIHGCLLHLLICSPRSAVTNVLRNRTREKSLEGRKEGREGRREGRRKVRRHEEIVG